MTTWWGNYSQNPVPNIDQHERHTTVKSKQTRSYISLAMLAVGMLLGADALAADAAPNVSSPVAANQPPVFATVGKITITQRDYDAAYASAARNKFYHGKPNDQELAVFQREIGDKLITEALLVNEAKSRKLKPDAEFVKQKLQVQDERNAGNPRWQQIRAQVLPKMTQQLEETSLRSKLEEIVRKVPAPNQKQLRKFYDENPKLFTEPGQMRVSVILLSVDPSSPPETWTRARDFGKDLIKQIREGASFAELAAKYSGDASSAQQGGDMGYLHAGMLNGVPEEAVKKLKPGEISDVVNLMEGVAIFQLTELKEPVLSNFDRVKERAGALWAEAESNRIWESFKEQLRKKTPVKVDESRYVPLAVPAVNNNGAPPGAAK
ncbi:MAG: peptidylprolyl isomerase [Nitrosomonadales bacterium]|nr:peptidylprolyl isomerase [Nitrosomonadales bacterium]